MSVISAFFSSPCIHCAQGLPAALIFKCLKCPSFATTHTFTPLDFELHLKYDHHIDELSCPEEYERCPQYFTHLNRPSKHKSVLDYCEMIEQEQKIEHKLESQGSQSQVASQVSSGSEASEASETVQTNQSSALSTHISQEIQNIAAIPAIQEPLFITWNYSLDQSFDDLQNQYDATERSKESNKYFEALFAEAYSSSNARKSLFLVAQGIRWINSLPHPPSAFDRRWLFLGQVKYDQYTKDRNFVFPKNILQSSSCAGFQDCNIPDSSQIIWPDYYPHISEDVEACYEKTYKQESASPMERLSQTHDALVLWRNIFDDSDKLSDKSEDPPSPESLTFQNVYKPFEDLYELESYHHHKMIALYHLQIANIQWRRIMKSSSSAGKDFVDLFKSVMSILRSLIRCCTPL